MPLHACAKCYQASLYTHFHYIHSTNIHMQTLAQTLTYRHTHKHTHTHTNTYTHSNLALMLAGQSATSALACGVSLRPLFSRITSCWCNVSSKGDRMHLFMQRGPVSAHEGLWHPSMRLGHASHFERSVRLCLWLGAASLFRTDMNNVN